MRRLLACCLLGLVCVTGLGCGGAPAKPQPLSADEEKQLQEQIDTSRKAEAGVKPPAGEAAP